MFMFIFLGKDNYYKNVVIFIEKKVNCIYSASCILPKPVKFLPTSSCI